MPGGATSLTSSTTTSLQAPTTTTTFLWCPPTAPTSAYSTVLSMVEAPAQGGKGRRLGWRTLFCYCFFQACLSAIYTDFQTGRTFVYKDALKLPLSQISWIVTAVKAVDILTGFVIGRVSDSMTSRWGRRKPFLIVLWPLGLAVIMALMLGDHVFTSIREVSPCSQYLTVSSTTNESCQALKYCYDIAIAQGRALPPNSMQTAINSTGSVPQGAGVQTYFFTFYLLYFTFVVSGSQIPYDALGQELTDEYDDRARLFMWKPLFFLLGAAIGSQLLASITSFYEDNLSYGTVLTFGVLTIFSLVAYLLLLWGVKERPIRPTSTSIPFAVSIRRLLSIRQYRYYLIMRLPMTCLALLPYQMLLFYMQNNLERESIAVLLGNAQVIAIVGALVSTPLLTASASKFGRPIVLSVVLCVVGALFVIAMFLPLNSAPSLIYCLAPFLGVCVAVPYVIPDAMLGEIIDYDELLTGQRNEAMYSMVETNVQQFVDVLLGFATMFMSWAGFENLSGCECGCGVSCNRQVGYEARWVCPGSIGYSCGGSIGARLFYEPEPPIAPCTIQTTSVRWVTAFFTFGLPGLCALLAIFPIRQATISKETHQLIARGIDVLKHDPSAAFMDPLTGNTVARPQNSPESLLEEHFTLWEWRLGQHGASLGALRKYIVGRLIVSALACVVLVLVNICVATDTMLQVSFCFFAVLFVLVPFDLLRLSAISRMPLLSSKAAVVEVVGIMPDAQVADAKVAEDAF